MSVQVEQMPGYQRNWDGAEVCGVMALSLMQGSDESERVHVCSHRVPPWLGRLAKCRPESAALGLNLNDSAVRVAVGLRLGVPLVLEHQCCCGTYVDKFGHHGPVCKRSARSSPAAQSTKRHHPPCPSECQCGCDPRTPRPSALRF